MGLKIENFTDDVSVRFGDGDLIGQTIGYLTEPGLSARRISPDYYGMRLALACVTFLQ